MRKILLSVFLLTVCLWQAHAQQPLTFNDEAIDFGIDQKYFTINGIYTFVNNTSETHSSNILYPFPVATTLIDSIRILNINTVQPLAYRKRTNGIVFSITISPEDTLQINIFYRQPTDTVNTYLLTSTKTWDVPLKKAVYTLTADKTVSLKSFSITPDSSETRENKQTWFWHKINYMPENEFKVYIDE
ncbi:MAG TPA: hypothetical protein VE912_16345 [Bacteroidales bacterium]|nr:hypothetical protein [Bacteroidales bacterium]